MEIYKFTAILKKELGTKTTYNVSFPSLPGCLTFGESLEEASFNAQEALKKKFYVSVEHKVTAGIPVYAETTKSHRR